MSHVRGKFVVKAKGIISSSVIYSDFIALLNYVNVNSAVKQQSIIFWSLGYVKITEEKLTINSDSYTKREKIYNKQNEWIDTKPMFINKIDKALVLYTQKKKFFLLTYEHIYKRFT